MNHDLRNSGARTSYVTDANMRWFYRLLALGVIAHEFAWYDMFVNYDGATIATYLAPYRLLTPTLPLPDWCIVAVHGLTLVLPMVMLVSSRFASLACLALFPVVSLLYFLQGTKPANHLFFLFVVFAVHAVYYLIDRVIPRNDTAPCGSVLSNRRFLRFNLLALLISTYYVAAFSKLNPTYLDPDSTVAAGFAWKLVSPLNHMVKELTDPDSWIPGALWYAYGVIGIISTFVFEVGIPTCFLIPRLRRIGLAMGVLFHLLILYFSAIDFSMVAMSIYPFLLTGAQLADLLDHHVRKVTWRKGLTTIAISVYLCAVSFDLDFREALFTPFGLYRSLHIVVVTYFALCLFTLLQREWLPRLGARGKSYALMA